MRILETLTEDDMIATFLRGEICSERFGDKIREAIAARKVEERIIHSPDTADPQQNYLRRLVLRKARGYGSGISWFMGLPKDIQWVRASVPIRELSQVRYIIHGYWLELSQGTLRARDAVPNIHAGHVLDGAMGERFHRTARAIEQGIALPEMILLGTSSTDLIVLEGHLRLTAYMLAGDKAPRRVTAVVGLSPQMRQWKMYSLEQYDKWERRAKHRRGSGLLGPKPFTPPVPAPSFA